MKLRRAPRLERWIWRRPIRWGAAALAVLLLPKCVACALAYFALAGAAGVEICGRAGTAANAPWSTAAAAGLIVLGAFISVQRLRSRRE